MTRTGYIVNMKTNQMNAEPVAKVFASYAPETEGLPVRRVFYSCRNRRCEQKPVEVFDYHYRLVDGAENRFGRRPVYAQFWLGYWEAVATLPRRACQFCGVTMTAEPLKAIKSDAKCDSKCTTARRADCECSCGGANHGAGRMS
jgi:hypothetical protein